MPATHNAQRLFVPDGLREPEPITVLSHGKGQQSTALGYMLHYEASIRERFVPGRLLTLHSAFDVYYKSVYSTEDYDRWVEMEADKLRDWRDELPPEKNHSVFPGKTLPEVLEEAREEFSGMSATEMHERRMAGHGVASRF